jgi:carboxyl-terminal processing protease
MPMKRLGRCGLAIIMLLSSVLALHAQVDRIDRGRMRDVLSTVSQDIQKNFYDPKLKGLDWKALTEQARQRIDDAKSINEMITAIFVLANKTDDSHTQFLPPGRVFRPLFGFAAKPFGDEIRVYAVKSKGPAEITGLRPGDVLLSVNGYRAERSTFDLMMLDFRVLRPKAELVISYARGNDPPQTVHLQAKINKGVFSQDLNTTVWRYLVEWDDDGGYSHGQLFDDDIAYLQIPVFDREELPSPHRLERTPRALILDLRGNPGGIQIAVLEMAGHFEPVATSMGEMITRKKIEPLKIKPQKPNFATVPVVVLIDSESSSAAEMLARHLQVSRKATVIGDHSAGRVNASLFFAEGVGTDRIVPFGVQISVGKIVLANGDELEKRGVTPDVPCLPSGDDLRSGRDPCLLQALSLVRKAAGLREDLSDKIRAEVQALIAVINADNQKQYDRERP